MGRRDGRHWFTHIMWSTIAGMRNWHELRKYEGKTIPLGRDSLQRLVNTERPVVVRHRHDEWLWVVDHKPFHTVRDTAHGRFLKRRFHASGATSFGIKDTDDRQRPVDALSRLPPRLRTIEQRILVDYSRRRMRPVRPDDRISIAAADAKQSGASGRNSMIGEAFILELQVVPEVSKPPRPAFERESLSLWVRKHLVGLTQLERFAPWTSPTHATQLGLPFSAIPVAVATFEHRN